MLVPDVNRMNVGQLSKSSTPMHVAVAHHDELRVNALRTKGFCEGFVKFGHERGTIQWGLPMAPCRRCNNWDSARSASGFKEGYIRPAHG
jgi:hypothetical protein